MPKKAAKKAPRKAAAEKAAPSLADWTILVYIAGDNDLDDFGADDLYEMKKVGSSDQLNIIAQRDTITEGAPTCRYRLRQGTKLDEDVVESLGETNTGDPEVLKDFLEWGLETYPAKRTMAVLWNHGSGWDDRDIYEEARRRGLNPPEPSPRADGTPRATGALPRNWRINRGLGAARNRNPFFISNDAFDDAGDGQQQRRAIAFDDEAQDFLDNVELKRVFTTVTQKRGCPFDIIGMDACLMSMIEVGIQLKDAGRLFCGSQENEPPQGWPYDEILKELAKKTTMDGRELCKVIVHKFTASYPPRSVTQSAFDLSRLRRVQEAVDDLGHFLAKGFIRQDEAVIYGVGRTAGRAKRFHNPDYTDLIDFCRSLAKDVPQASLLCDEVEQSLTKDCVFATQTTVKERSEAGESEALDSDLPKPEPAAKRAHGLSIYLPRASLSPLYKELDFAGGGWAKFLRAKEF